MKRILLAGAALFALTSVSSAADLGLPPIVESDAWAGYYVGLQGGYAFSDLTVDNDTDLETFGSDYDGGFGGVYWGRNWQSGSWVFGLDGSFQVAAIDSDIAIVNPEDPSVETEFFSASRLRVGYAFDNVMLFAAGGFSLAKVNVENDFGDEDAYLKGFTVGAGVEMMIAEGWSARLEYLYLNYDEEQRTIFAGGDTTTYQINVEDVHAIRAGVAYHF